MSLGSRLYFSAMLSPAVVEAAMLGSMRGVVRRGEARVGGREVVVAGGAGNLTLRAEATSFGGPCAVTFWELRPR